MPLKSFQIITYWIKKQLAVTAFGKALTEDEFTILLC